MELQILGTHPPKSRLSRAVCALSNACVSLEPVSGKTPEQRHRLMQHRLLAATSEWHLQWLEPRVRCTKFFSFFSPGPYSSMKQMASLLGQRKPLGGEHGARGGVLSFP